MTANPWLPAKYAARLDDVIVTSDGPQRITLPPSKADELLTATRDALEARQGTPPRLLRPSLVDRVRRRLRPARTTRHDALVARYRWANDGLRERLRVEFTTHDATLDSVQAQADEWARTLGHAHPLIVGLRSTVAQGRVR